MSQDTHSHMNQNVAFRLLLYGVWIPHLHNVTDDEGELVYGPPRPSPPDKGLIMIPEVHETRDGILHNLWNLTNEHHVHRIEFWQSVFDVKARFKENERDEFGRPLVEWPEQLFWSNARNNQERRALVRELLYHLEWLHLREIRTFTGSKGKRAEAIGEENWGLSFVPHWYTKNKPLAYSFFQAYQSKVTEDWRWASARHPRTGVRNFRHLVVADQIEKEKPIKASTSSSLEEFEGFLS